MASLLLACSLACGAADAQDELQVLTYNIRWAAPTDGLDQWQYRRSAMKAFLLDEGSDLVALQEVTPRQLDDLVPGVPGQATWSLRAQVAALLGPRVMVHRVDVLELPGGQYPRGALFAELEIAGRALTFVSTHLSGDEAGRAQTEAIVEALAGRPRPWVLAGDFNAYPMTDATCLALPEPYHVLCNGAYVRLQEVGFTDPLADLLGVGPRSTATGFQPAEERWMPDFDARIDWVLVTEELTAVEARILDPLTEAGRPLSDHRPVQVRLAFTDPPVTQ